MKITNVETTVYQWPRKKSITNGKLTYKFKRLTFVAITTDEGITGVGEGGGGNGLDWSVAIPYFKEMLIGEDPLCNELLWHKLWEPKLVGRRGISTRAISAIDNAIWDIKAKTANMPLYKLLGGARKRIPVYIAGGYYEKGKTLADLGEEMKSYVAMGTSAVKMKIGSLPIEEDAKRVEAVRKAVGDDIKVLLDANCAYNVHDAIQFAKRVEEYNPYWFEEPVQPDDYEGFKRIGQATSVPIATGENEMTRFGFRDLIIQGEVPILNADALECGGVSEWMKIAALAQAHNRMMAPHGIQAIHIHLQCAVSNSLILEYYPPRFLEIDNIYTYAIELNADGTASPPEVPGHGFYPNLDALGRYKIN
jgi:D-arabinonate dehydratase